MYILINFTQGVAIPILTSTSINTPRLYFNIQYRYLYSSSNYKLLIFRQVRTSRYRIIPGHVYYLPLITSGSREYNGFTDFGLNYNTHLQSNVKRTTLYPVYLKNTESGQLYVQNNAVCLCYYF